MKFVILFLVLFVTTACQAQDDDDDDKPDKNRALAELLKFNPVTFIFKSGVRFSTALLKQVKDAVVDVTNILKNVSLSFTAAIPDTVLWTPSELSGRNSIFNLFGNRRTFKDTKWNYTYVNHVKLGHISPVKNQGKCGSCYAFGGVAAMEAQDRYSGRGENLYSEQQIVDCTYKKYPSRHGTFNSGCKSGLSYYALKYFDEANVVTPSRYPYTQKHGSCQVDEPRSGPKIHYQEVEADNEDHLAYLLNKNGPLVVYIIVNRSFGYYSKGIFNDSGCRGKVNHAVLLSGIGKTADGEEYWIIKNSWGPKWGNKGFIKFKKGVNMCSMISNNVTIASYDKIITE